MTGPGDGGDRLARVEKDAAPVYRKARSGLFSAVNLKGLAQLGAGAGGVLVLLWLVWGVEYEEPPDEKPKVVQVPRVDFAAARPPVPPPVASSAVVAPGMAPGTPPEAGGTGAGVDWSGDGEGDGAKPEPPPPPPPPPVPRQNRPKSVVMAPGAWAGGNGGGGGEGTGAVPSRSAAARPGADGGPGYEDVYGEDGGHDMAGGDYGDGYGGAEGYGGGYGRRRPPDSLERSRRSKQRFARGEDVGGGDLDMKGQWQAEAPGCVVKADTYVPVQVERRVETTLPGRVRARVTDLVWGKRFLPGGGYEDCEAIPAFSSVSLALNTSGVARGDDRLQACVLRIDINGGGRRNVGCQPAHGADGAAGVEAEVDYQLGALGAAILVDAVGSVIESLGDLVVGVPGAVLQVGTRRLDRFGESIIEREFERPPTLTIGAGANFGFQLNADLSMPLRGRVR